MSAFVKNMGLNSTESYSHFFIQNTFFLLRTAVRRLALTTPLGQRHLQAGKFWSSPNLFNPCQDLLSATSV